MIPDAHGPRFNATALRRLLRVMMRALSLNFHHTKSASGRRNFTGPELMSVEDLTSLRPKRVDLVRTCVTIGRARPQHEGTAVRTQHIELGPRLGEAMGDSALPPLAGELIANDGIRC